MNATTDPWTERLSERLDGTLTDEERGLLDAHLATCADCRLVLGDLERVVARARTLPEIAPEVDLWAGIAARVAGFARETDDLDAARRRKAMVRGLTLSWPQLVAAGLTLVILSGGAAWFMSRSTRGDGSIAAGSRLTPATNASVAPAHVDPAYAAEVASLEKELAEGRNTLDPETVKTIEANLKIIDLATMQARQALAADPGNPYLKEYLSKSMRRKVELLKQATVYASAQ
jgi:anti-sigma factor RsiW